MYPYGGQPQGVPKHSRTSLILFYLFHSLTVYINSFRSFCHFIGRIQSKTRNNMSEAHAPDFQVQAFQIFQALLSCSIHYPTNQHGRHQPDPWRPPGRPSSAPRPGAPRLRDVLVPAPMTLGKIATAPMMRGMLSPQRSDRMDFSSRR